MPLGFVASAVAANTVNTSWNAYLNYRQYRATFTPFQALPADMRSLTTEADFDKAQRYCRERSKFAVVRGLATGLVVDNAWLLSGAVGRVWDVIGKLSWIPRSGFWHSYAWGATFDVVTGLLSLPWDVYSTFVIEHKHGFNRTTVGTFVADRVKGLLLNLALVRPITTWLLRFVVARFGASFPLYLCGAATVLILAATFFVPTFIMPMFNKFDPLPEGEVRSRIEALSAKVKFPLTKLFVMDGSKRSSHSNAFFYGFWRNKRIVLFDVLLEQMTPEEIEAVIAHELGHWHHQHMLQNLGITLGTLAAYSYGAAATIFNPALYGAFGMPRGEQDAVVGFELFSLVYGEQVSELSKMAGSLLSRKFEFQADRFATDLGYAPQLSSGLVKMFKENSATLTPDWLYAACRYSHPPLRERLAALRRAPAERPKQQ